jgi:hypothetical protein
MKSRRPAFLTIIGTLLLSVVLGTSAVAQPPADEIPPVIKAGLEAYKVEGPEAAIKAWLKGSALEGSKDALSQANVLRQIQDYYGSYESFEVISTRNVTKTTQIVYLAMNFQKGPVFARFMVYHAADGWVSVTFTFNTKSEAILPNP